MLAESTTSTTFMFLFQSIFCEQGMFMKPNAKAFPHVTRYLMIICDATEFRKTFRWPIYDKAGEALFR